MAGLDPRLVVVICLLFIGLGIFNLVLGFRRLQQLRMQGQKLAWYKQISILTGVEYILLAIAFLLSVSINYGWLPRSLSNTIFPFYVIMLILSGLLAGFVVYQGFQNNRRMKQAAAASQQVPHVTTMESSQRSKDDDEAQRKRQRERRQKAAAARKRRSGRA